MGSFQLSILFLTFEILFANHIEATIGMEDEPTAENERIPNLNSYDEPFKMFNSFTDGFGEPKRNFDEINRFSFGFGKRKNFDEIGRSAFGFGKRQNFDEIGRSAFGFTKRLQRNPDYLVEELDLIKKGGGFDEIGRSSFGFYRRSPLVQRPLLWRYFPGFGRRSVAGLNVKENARNFNKE